jgi:hypothetical protein
MKYIRTEKGIEKLTEEEASALKPAPTYKQLRKAEYGSIEEQIEFITENGFEAWQQKVWKIKNQYPKPKTLTGI